MRGRKSGRELFEVFRETTQKATPADAKPQAALREERGAEYDEPVHEIRLGERRQIEITLSHAWAYGVSIFLIMVLAGAFALGRRFAPIEEPAPTIEATEALIADGRQVGEVTGINAPATLTPAAPRPASPQAAVTGQGGNFVCVVTYVSPNSRDTISKAEEVVEFLKRNGYKDVRSLVTKDGRFRVVAVGKFTTVTTVEAKETLATISELEYRNKKEFSKPYFANVKYYQ